MVVSSIFLSVYYADECQNMGIQFYDKYGVVGDVNININIETHTFPICLQNYKYKLFSKLTNNFFRNLSSS